VIKITKKIIFSTKQINEMKNLYNDGLSHKDIGKYFNVSASKIQTTFKEYNIKSRNPGGQPQYKINQKYFSEINSKEKAYILGLFYSDGSVYISGRSYVASIGLKEDDKKLLLDVKNEVGYAGPLYYIKPRKDRYSNIGQYTLSFTNKKIYQDLIKLGVKNTNSLPNIKEEYMNHFIRGYFDGDGCISYSIRNDNHHKNSLNCEFYIMGYKDMLNEISDEFEKNDIFMQKPKFHKSDMYKIRKSGRLAVLKIKDYLYKDANIYLKRKHDKFAVLNRNV
jgi:intein-encoded DNA endonuclease-like protein